MPGGAFNLESAGDANVILNGNPKKSFFKVVYAKHSNFGMQKYRVDFEGAKKLQLTEPSIFRFNIPRYADLLTDTYFVMTLPTIWSPIYNPTNLDLCQPYEFKWIENLGTQLIQRVRILINDQLIQEFTGQYLVNMMHRDFTKAKQTMFDEMTGNTAELNDPANYNNRNGNYPNASYNNFTKNDWPNGVEPSIRGRKIYVPLNAWFSLLSTSALPLVSLQYGEVFIEITCRPIVELFVVRDIEQYISQGPGSHQFVSYTWPNPIGSYYNLYYFLYEPPEGTRGITGSYLDDDLYPSKRTDWAADIHLICSYIYLDEQQIRSFASNKQSYLIKEVHEHDVYNIVATKEYLQNFNTISLVSSWMWFFQRSDVNLRNEWSNYGNWDYNYLPFPGTAYQDISVNPTNLFYIQPGLPVYPSNGKLCSVYLTGPQHVENTYEIMTNWGLVFDHTVRETTYDAGNVSYLEQYLRSHGNTKNGLYCYNFCMDTDPFKYQPSGAINLSKFDTIGFEFTTIEPPDISGAIYVSTLCNFVSPTQAGVEIATNKPAWAQYKYSYNLHIMEERYNMLVIENGTGALALAR